MAYHRPGIFLDSTSWLYSISVLALSNIPFYFAELRAVFVFALRFVFILLLAPHTQFFFFRWMVNLSLEMGTAVIRSTWVLELGTRWRLWSIRGMLHLSLQVIGNGFWSGNI